MGTARRIEVEEEEEEEVVPRRRRREEEVKEEEEEEAFVLSYPAKTCVAGLHFHFGSLRFCFVVGGGLLLLLLYLWTSSSLP